MFSSKWKFILRSVGWKGFTRTVYKPICFPAWTLRTLSSKKICRAVSPITHELAQLKRNYWDKEKEDAHARLNSSSNRHLTVLWGSMLAILRAWSIASTYGLHRIGVFGSSTPSFGRDKWPTISKILPSVSDSEEEDGGFRVSKQMIPSKQSSSPSLLRTLAAWILSPFVNICRIGTKKKTRVNWNRHPQRVRWKITAWQLRELTTLRIGRLRRMCLRTGSGLIFS